MQPTPLSIDLHTHITVSNIRKDCAITKAYSMYLVYFWKKI